MLDYYQAFLEKYSGNTLDHEPTKPTEEPFARFVGSVSNEFAKKTTGERFGILQELDEDQRVIFEERIAIMMFDGGLSEEEAVRYLTTIPST